MAVNSLISDAENYLWDAKEYAKHSQNQYEWALELIPKLKLKGNEVLLDIGCGDGKVSATLASYLPNGRVVGIDSSEEMDLASLYPGWFPKHRRVRSNSELSRMTRFPLPS